MLSTTFFIFLFNTVGIHKGKLATKIVLITMFVDILTSEENLTDIPHL